MTSAQIDQMSEPIKRVRMEWVTVAELCAAIEEELRFRPGEKTVIRWRKEGCPHLPLSCRRIRYQPDKVIAWLCQNEVIGRFRKQKRSLGRMIS